MVQILQHPSRKTHRSRRDAGTIPDGSPATTARPADVAADGAHAQTAIHT